MGAQLMAIAAEGKRQRYYLAPTTSTRRQPMFLARTTCRKPSFPSKPSASGVQGLRHATWADLFTNRQLTALTTFSDLVMRSARERTSLTDGGQPSLRRRCRDLPCSCVSAGMADISNCSL